MFIADISPLKTINMVAGTGLIEKRKRGDKRTVPLSPDILKYVALIVLSAVGTLYFALAGIWGFPFGEEIVGTLSAIETFLGAILVISTAQYNKDNK